MFTIAQDKLEVASGFRLEAEKDGSVSVLRDATPRAHTVPGMVRPGVEATIYCMCRGGLDSGCTAVVSGTSVYCMNNGCSSCTMVVSRGTSRTPLLTITAGRLQKGADVDVEDAKDGALLLRPKGAVAHKAGTYDTHQQATGPMKVSCTCVGSRGACVLVVEGSDLHCQPSGTRPCSEECRLTVTIE